MQEKRPKVGVGVLVEKNGKFLLLKRKNAHGAGQWGGTGGHLEYLESFTDCAKRETTEEAGIEIENVRVLCVTNFTQHAPKHYVDIGVIADWKAGEPRILEPEKCSEMGWFGIDEFPQPLFGVMPNYLQALKNQRHFFDA